MNNQSGPRYRIEGYADPLSVRAGDKIAFHVSSDAERYSIEISRVGADRQVVWTRKDLRGTHHATPENAATHGCGWPAALTETVPEDWKSGYYSVILRGAGPDGDDVEGEMFFVVRSAHPGRDTGILLQLTTNTANAYNTWGGSSLYRGSHGPAWRVSFDRPYAGLSGVDGLCLLSIDAEFQETLDRGVISGDFQEAFQEQVHACNVPGISLSERGSVTTEQPGRRWRLDDLSGAGPPAYKIKKNGRRLDVYDGTPYWECGWRNWEQPFVAWAERAGYEIDYAVNSDLEFHPEILENYRLVLSVGHDEYWSAPMRDHLEAFIAGGGNVAFFGGNCAWRQVRCEDNGRALVCWKEAYKQDPVYKDGDHKLLSTYWCHHLIGRPENQLTGVSFAYGGYSRFFDQFPDASGGYTVHRPDHWIFEATGLKQGDLLGAPDKIVSYECDGCEFELQEGLPVPTCRDGTPETFEILATAEAGLSRFDESLQRTNEALYGEGPDNRHPQPGAAVLGTYTRGGTVVTSGTCFWSDGLRGGDPAVERITRNILDRLSVSGDP
jgi:hypothetical protein